MADSSTDDAYCDPLRSALFTDLYELTMAQAYHAEGMEQSAVFEFFFRRMPTQRNYMLTAGIADVVAALEEVRFHDHELAYLHEQELFTDEFLERLRSFRFTGDVYALPEGTPAFPHEPLLQVVAPMVEAQLIETLVINQIHFQTLVATKAARVVTAARGRPVVDFGSRRAHGSDAALKMARASYLAGAAGTSNVLAGQRYRIPIFGTMAHSYVQAHDDEGQAFQAFARQFPDSTLLVDTYDTLDGVQKVIDLSCRLGDRFRVHAIRLDSGDFLMLAQQSRQLLDDAGLHKVQIFVSGGLDEYSIAELVRAGAPIDGFGVGTKLAVVADAPYLDCAYKLVEYAGRPRLKLSSSKVIYPGRKQVFRRTQAGRMAGDVISRCNEKCPGKPLLQLVMRDGQRLAAGSISLEEARQHAERELRSLGPDCLGLTLSPYPIEFSAGLQQDLTAFRQALEARSARQE
ncbi:MAG: nicotinate phosphoribosyltransferase [Planctomycetota bacterium]